MSNNETNGNEKKKMGFVAETKSFYAGVGNLVKEHKMWKVVAGTVVGILGGTAAVVATVWGVKKIRGNGDSVEAIPEDAKDVTPTDTEE